MLLFLVCWLVVSAVVGAFVGKAIHRADVMEQRRVPCRRPGAECTQPEAPHVAASAEAPSPVSVAHVLARAA